MRCFKGEFIYHEVTWRNNYPGWAYIEDDDISKNDAVIVSLPFSDYGAEHPDMQSMLDKCDELNVPVFIDCAASQPIIVFPSPLVAAVRASLPKAIFLFPVVNAPPAFGPIKIFSFPLVNASPALLPIAILLSPVVVPPFIAS